MHITLAPSPEEKSKLTTSNNLSQSKYKIDYQNSDTLNVIMHSIYLQYSIQEGFCNAVLEAQALGLLTIVSDAEGLPENVIHGETGWVVPKRKPKFFAQKTFHGVYLTDRG